jgi:carbon-monoxide dehydrogenase medium subunit
MYRTLNSFELCEPATLDEALDLLTRHKDEAKVLAGGVDLVHKTRLRQLMPKYVVSLQRIPRLDYVEGDGRSGLRIGALAKLRTLELYPVIRKDYEVLFEGVRAIASKQIKTMATVIGNLCVGTPASDIAPPLSVLDANLSVVSAESKRDIPIQSFFVDGGKTVLKPYEIVTEITVPGISPGSGSAFLKVGKTKADIAKVNAAVLVRVREDRWQDVRIALGSVAPTVIRATKAEESLKGKNIDEGSVSEAAGMAAEETKPLSDIRSTAAYRKHMARILVRDALRKALERAGRV